MLECVLGHSGQEVVAQTKLSQLLQWFESIIRQLIQNVVLEIESANLRAAFEDGVPYREEVIEAEVDREQAGQEA